MTEEIIDFNNAKARAYDAKVRAHDHIVRGTAADGQLRAFAINGRETVQEASNRHHTSNVVTAALGRLMMAGQMMGAMSKVDDELLTLSVHGDGPVGGITVTANNKGQVKGFANHPNVWIPLREDSHLDVGGALGAGTLTVVHDIPHMEPYSSTIGLVSGEIGDDLTYYFAESEQIPTSLGVGVLVDVDYSVRQAGGFVIQAMPGCEDYVLDALEKNLQGVKSVTQMLEEGMTPSSMLDFLLRGLDYQELDAMPAEFHCGCDRDRAARCVMALGEAEIRDIIQKGETADVHCHFCGENYVFQPEELQRMIDQPA
ncbi:MAG: Hsp33 family molecular chaperone HslO [Atopobiaceae bacterium]